jgi:hypothetical protein
MKLDTVLTACNDNPTYMGFIPAFIRTWRAIAPGVKVKVYLIADRFPKELADFSDCVELFPAPQGVSSVFVSQYCRLLLPATEKGTVLISDVDMLPLSRRWFLSPLKKMRRDEFLSYRNVLEKDQQVAICYNCADAAIWQRVFGIESKDDVRGVLQDVYLKHVENVPESASWFMDQLHLFERLRAFEAIGGVVVKLSDQSTGFARLDRCNGWNDGFERIRLFPNRLKRNIINGYYSDYHAGRPYEMYSKATNEVIRLVECPTLRERIIARLEVLNIVRIVEQLRIRSRMKRIARAIASRLFS